MYSMRLHIIDITTQLDSMKMRMSELESKLDVSYIVTTTDKLKKEVEEIAENAEETTEEV